MKGKTKSLTIQLSALQVSDWSQRMWVQICRLRLTFPISWVFYAL